MMVSWIYAAGALLIATTLISWPQRALAYRPFDSTDASVADKGEVEIELGPIGYVKRGPEKTLVSPALVFSYGLTENWELVAEGRGNTALSGDARQTAFSDDQVSLKGILRQGSLQEQSGPSVAVEIAALLPEVRGEHGAGASAAAIISQQMTWGTLHFNAKTTWVRAHKAEISLGGIAEGPAPWKVRPVAEVFYERTKREPRTVSGLVGAIWQVKDNLALDVGLKHTRSAGPSANEIRLGLTVAFLGA